jgi:DnaJ family protein A protein 5
MVGLHRWRKRATKDILGLESNFFLPDFVSQGFFIIFRNLFDRLASDERHYTDVQFPSFGYSTWGWTAPSKENPSEAARLFYNFWLNFATAKEFTWSDRWNLSEAPDRHIRR